MKRITIKLDKLKWVNSSKQIADLRAELLIEQKGIDPITKEPVIDPCLDHDHAEGFVRGVIGSKINLFEGAVAKLWGRHVEGITNTSLSTALRNMADYLEADVFNAKLHGGIIEDQKKALRRMTNETIVRRAGQDLGLALEETGDKSENIRAYLEEMVKQLEERKALWG